MDPKRSSFRDCLRVLHLCAQRRSAPVARGARCVKSDAGSSASKIFLTTVAKKGCWLCFLYFTSLYCSAPWHTPLHVVTVIMLASSGGYICSRDSELLWKVTTRSDAGLTHRSRARHKKKNKKKTITAVSMGHHSPALFFLQLSKYLKCFFTIMNISSAATNINNKTTGTTKIIIVGISRTQENIISKDFCQEGSMKFELAL